MITFNTLIKGFCVFGKFSVVIRLVPKMGVRGCQPDIVTYSTIRVSYSTIINGLCKDRLVVDALKLFTEMISRDIALYVVAYNTLIRELEV